MPTNALRYTIAFGHLLFAPELRAWRGQQPLARVFWIYGVLTSFGLAAFYLAAALAHRPSLQQALVITFAAYTGWVLMAVWRCAEQAPPQLRALVRSLALVWAVNTVMFTGFLELDLVAASMMM